MSDGSSSKRPARLGRGLSALVGNAPVRVEIPANIPVHSTNISTTPPTQITVSQEVGGVSLVMAPVSSIVANPHQPRRVFDEAALETLAASIRAEGLMQPVVVRRVGDGFELVAGERRLRAARLAGLSEIPAIVRDLDDRASAELALIENLQRADLNPVERAMAFRALIDRHGLTQAQLGERLGVDRTNVTNHLRLLDLGDEVLAMVADGRLSYAHGRALGGVIDAGDRLRMAERAVEEGWSVRALERAVASDAAHRVAEATRILSGKSGKTESGSDGGGAGKSRTRAVLDDLEKRLGEHLGTRVALKTDKSGQRGEVTISFFSLDEFDGLLERLGYSAH
jgi:ParB family chromosome partitioning protein